MQPSPPSVSGSFRHPHHKFCTQEALTPHPRSLSLQPVVISVLLPALWICQQHVLANTLGDWRGGRCIQIWELSDQIISRVPLGGGGFGCSVIADYLWTVACQTPLSMGFPRQEYWVGSHSLLWGIFLTQGLNSCLLPWQAGSLPTEPPRKPGSLLSFTYLGKGRIVYAAAGSGPMFILKPAGAVSPTWLWWRLFLFTFTEQSWSALSCGTASSSPAPVPGPEWLPLRTIPLPLSVVSLQVSFIIHAAWQLLPCSRCLVWSLWFPPITLTLVIPLISRQNHSISQLPVHPFIPPVSVVWGCLPVDSEKMNIAVFRIPRGMSGADKYFCLCGLPWPELWI